MELVDQIKKGFADAESAHATATAERRTMVIIADEDEQKEEKSRKDPLKHPDEKARDM